MLLLLLVVVLDDEEVHIADFASGDDLTEISTSHFVSSPQVAVYKSKLEIQMWIRYETVQMSIFIEYDLTDFPLIYVFKVDLVQSKVANIKPPNEH